MQNIPTNQHHIPRFLMRGFLSRKNGENAYTIAYRRKSVNEVNTKNVGASRFFYTKRCENRIESELSKLEAYLAPFHSRLIEGSFDPEKESELAAQLLAHCSIRSKAMRMEIEGGAETLCQELTEILNDNHRLRDFLAKQIRSGGLSFDEIVEPYRAAGDDVSWVLETITDQPEILIQFLDKNKINEFKEALTRTVYDPNSFARNVHLQSMAQCLCPDERVSRFLSNQSWLCRLDSGSLVLGDSMVVQVDNKGRPVVNYDLDESDTATILPITPQHALVNTKSPIRMRSKIIDAVIQSSVEFFVFTREESFLHRRKESIGKISGRILRKIVEQEIRAYFGRRPGLGR